jgi:hypothetical protein
MPPVRVKPVIVSSGQGPEASPEVAVRTLKDGTKEAPAPDPSMRRMSTGYYDGSSPPIVDENAEEVEVEVLHQERRHTCLLIPNTRITDNWDKLMLVLLMYTAVVTPCEVAFSNKLKYDALFVINRMVDFCFLLDMGVNFNLAYLNQEDQVMITDRRRIIRHYILGWFPIDLISIIPFDLVGGGGGEGEGQDGGGSSNLKIFRVIRLLRLVKLMRLVKAATVFGRIKSKLGTSHSTMELCKYLTWLFMLMHWSACLWRIIPKMEDAQVNWLSEARRKDGEHAAVQGYADVRDWEDGVTVYGTTCAHNTTVQTLVLYSQYDCTHASTVLTLLLCTQACVSSSPSSS